MDNYPSQPNLDFHLRWPDFTELASHRLSKSAPKAGAVEMVRPPFYRDWDEFVRQHPDGSLYHLSSWKIAVETAFRHIRGYFIAKRDFLTNRICAGLPIYVVSSRLTGRRLVSVPFAPFAGPLVRSVEDALALLEKASELFAKTGAFFAEVRTRRANATLAAHDFADSRGFVHHYLSLDGGLDEIYRRAHRKGLRIPIAKALKRGLVCEADCHRKDISLYYSIYSAARRKLGLPVMPDTFFFALWDELAPKGHLQLLFCLNDSRPIGTALLLTFKDMTMIEYGHTLPGHRAYCVDPFLDSQALRLAWQRGCKYVSFGRTALTNSGLMTYKRHWSPQEELLHNYSYPAGAGGVTHQGAASWQYRAARHLCRHCPESIYPILSRAIYRHLG